MKCIHDTPINKPCMECELSRIAIDAKAYMDICENLSVKIAAKDKYIAALEARIDTLQQDKQNAALEYLSLEGQCREMSAELIELRELVGVHKEQRDGPQYPNPEEIKAAGDEATPAAAKSPA